MTQTFGAMFTVTLLGFVVLRLVFGTLDFISKLLKLIVDVRELCVCVEGETAERVQ